jgi:hypothetical protein
MTWYVTLIESVEPDPSRDTVAAAVVQLARETETTRIIVELSRTAADSGITLDARVAVAPYLDEDHPPATLIVTSGGVQPGE